MEEGSGGGGYVGDGYGSYSGSYSGYSGSYGSHGSYGGSAGGYGVIGHGHFVAHPSSELSLDADSIVRQINASRARRPAVPPGRVTFTIPAPTLVGGELDQDIIRRYVRRKEQALTYCYAREILASPTLGGTVRASFTINDGGQVSGVTAAGLGNAKVEACIAEALASLVFPRPEGGPVRVSYAFVLKPPPAEGP